MDLIPNNIHVIAHDRENIFQYLKGDYFRHKKTAEADFI